MKILKKLKRALCILRCNLEGHSPTIVIEYRPRYKKRHKWSSSKGGKPGSVTMVKGYYYRCSVCKKKLSNFLKLTNKNLYD